MGKDGDEGGLQEPDSDRERDGAPAEVILAFASKVRLTENCVFLCV